VRRTNAFDRIQNVKSFAEILELPARERLQLLEAIWDSLIETPDAVPLTDDMRQELDRRLASYYRDPSSARPWDEIKDELFGRK
jgi:putative addiction module component (TIGR02574 family)